MPDVYKMLCRRLPQIEFVFYAQHPEADLLLILNACPAACVIPPEFNGPILNFCVLAPTWHSETITPESLADKIACEIGNALQ